MPSGHKQWAKEGKDQRSIIYLISGWFTPFPSDPAPVVVEKT